MLTRLHGSKNSHQSAMRLVVPIAMHAQTATDLLAASQLCKLTLCANPPRAANAIQVHAQGLLQGASAVFGAV